MDEPKTPAGIKDARELDLESLKGLAHPLRLALFDALSTYGPATASALAERLGESSGATSYHLRQLERHGFVREVEGKGTARERWWERVPGAVNLSSREVIETPAGRMAADLVTREFQQARSRSVNDFLAYGYDRLPDEWTDSSVISSMNLRLTKEELRELVELVNSHIEPFLEARRGKNLPGSRPIQVHFNAFPVIDGEVTPETSE